MRLLSTSLLASLLLYSHARTIPLRDDADTEDPIVGLTEAHGSNAQENDWEMTMTGSAHQSDAFSFGKLLKGAAKIFFREDGEMLTRGVFEELVARDSNIVARDVAEQSGSFSFGKLIKGASMSNCGREFEDELMTPDFEDLLAREGPVNEDGAFSFGKLVKGASMSNCGRELEDELMTPDFEDILARDALLGREEEMYTRDDIFAGRALDELD